MNPGTVKVYRRRNKLGIRTKLWGWNLTAPNGRIIAGDMGQGYFNKRDAVDMAHRVTGGTYAGAAFEIEGGLD